MNAPDRVAVALTYSWQPFTFRGRHLTFAEHRLTRLSRADCSHWGPAVYKWEGPISHGLHAGEVGVLIGETSDLRQRLKQYMSGTQSSGNKYWREEFLQKGDIRLYVLEVGLIRIDSQGRDPILIGADAVTSGNVRLVLEQILVWNESSRVAGKRWIVNKRL